MKNMLFTGLAAILLTLVFTSCSEDEAVPKPRAYYRIDLPQKSYKQLDMQRFPYSFEYPATSKIQQVIKEQDFKNINNDENYWVNIVYPQFNGAIYLTYKKANNPEDLLYHIDTCSQFITLHYQKASGVGEKNYVDENRKVYASVFHIKGRGVASPYQFWITDSTKHFLRGALYFNSTPNNDSIAPVIEYISKDIEHLINTLNWK